MGHDVFISYSSEDREGADRIREFLHCQGIRCWIDKKDLRFAGHYDREIEKAIRRSRVVVWLASRRSIESEYVKFEISTALNHNKPVGPVYLEPMDPAGLPAPFNLKLAAVQGIEYYAGPAEEMLEKLAQELGTLVRSSRRRRLALSTAVAAATVAVALGLWSILPDPEGGEDAVVPDALPSSDPWAVPPAKSLPAQVAGLSAADVLEVAYTGSPPIAASQTTRPGIQMEILARRSGETTFSPLEDGNTLHSETDDYFLAFRPRSSGFLYVFQVDSQGKKTWLFPENETSDLSSGINPLESEVVVQVPSLEEKRVLFLDSTEGIEHIYTVFSSTPWPELEEVLARPGRPWPVSPPTDAGPAQVAVRSPNGLLVRGVGGARVIKTTDQIAEPFLVQRTDRDKTYSLPISTELLQASGSFLVIERWFRHEARK